jgi:outer membrane protein OmpA-like peptidoglycan-associated protein
MRRAPLRTDADYRRGLVLGLTMAEVMLLLVFCLLIALSALLTRERRDEADVTADPPRPQPRAETLVREATVLSDLLRQVETAAPAESRAIDETWRRLIRDGGLVADLARSGLSPEALKKNGAFLAEVAPLAGDATAEEIRQALVFARRVRADLGLPPDALADAVVGRVDAVEAAARAARPGRRVDLPPILTLREDRGFYFETGSAVPSDAFLDRLRSETAPELARLIETYDVDVVEVIGHTDERRVATGTSNLDDTLLDVVRGGPAAAMIATDNAGLGLARAVAVAQVLKEYPALAGHEILPLSAGQLVGTDDRLTVGGGGDVPERRRIEIRLRRSTMQE